MGHYQASAERDDELIRIGFVGAGIYLIHAGQEARGPGHKKNTVLLGNFGPPGLQSTSLTTQCTDPSPVGL